MSVVGQNVWLILIVLVIKHACSTNVAIHALGHAALTRIVLLLIICPCVVAQEIWLVAHSYPVHRFKVCTILKRDENIHFENIFCKSEIIIIK